MTEYLTLGDALAYAAADGWHLRDVGLLDSALARPSSAPYGQEAYPGLHLKAAVVMDSIARSHPLIDGNKRASLALADLFYRLNDYQITSPWEEVVEFVVRVAGEHPPIEEIAAWLEANTAPLGPNT